jgi:hypothetical protein
MGNQIYFKIAGIKKKLIEGSPDTFLEENHPMTISSKFVLKKKKNNTFRLIFPKL